MQLQYVPSKLLMEMVGDLYRNYQGYPNKNHTGQI